MKNVREDATTALTRAAKDMARFYDAHRQEAPEYKKGDKVYLEGTNIRSDRPTKKRLKLPPMWKRIHPVFHTSLLRRYNPPSFKTQENPPPPPMVDIEGIPKREVAEILVRKPNAVTKGHQNGIFRSQFPTKEFMTQI